MSYHDLSQCTLTADERILEAYKICEMLKCVAEDDFSRVERDFIARIEGEEFCSVKQLFWLRDILAKHQRRPVGKEFYDLD